MSKPTAVDPIGSALLATGLELGARILVAVSGGPDSVCLLTRLVALAPNQHWTLRVAHVHHGLRGTDADGDQEFVEALARTLSLECDVARVDVPVHAEEHGLSIEAAARQLRYAALRSLLLAWPGDVIAAGHTLDDQAETVLLNLMRGSGAEGLAGMRIRDGTILRPLLTVDRATVLRDLEKRGQSFRLDRSNLDLRFERNRVRAQVIPVMNSVRPMAPRLLARTASVLRQDADFIAGEAKRLHSYLDVHVGHTEASASRPVWLTLHPALQTRIVRDLAHGVLGERRDLEARHVELAVHALQAPFRTRIRVTDRLPRGLALEVDEFRFRFYRPEEPIQSTSQSTELLMPGRVSHLAGTVSAEVLVGLSWEELRLKVAVCGPFHALLDAESLPGPFLVRSWQPGDRMRPLGLDGSRKLQDLFVDRKVPQERRRALPVVEHQGTIVWVAGVAVSGTVRITPRSSRVAHLCYRAF